MTDLPEQVAPAFKTDDDYISYGRTAEEVDKIKAERATNLQDALMDLDVTLLTDSGMAGLIGRALAYTLAWTPGRGWLRYSDGVWNAIHDVEARDVLRLTLDEYWRKVVVKIPPHELQAMKKFLGLMAASKIESIFKLMAGVLRRDDELFDSDPFLLCVGNGVVDMSKKHPTKHHARLVRWNPSLFMTKKTEVRYMPDPYFGDPDTQTREQIRLAQKDFGTALEALPDPEEVLWLQSRLGQAATGLTPQDQRVVFAIGGGANGKSVIMNAAERCLGTYAARVHESLLTAGENLGANMSLMGVRLALLEELPQGHLLPDKVLKDLTDEGTMQGRYLYKNLTTFEPSHSLFVTTNYRPIVAEIDESVWRRLSVLSFPLRFQAPGVEPERETDRTGDPGLKARMWSGQFHLEAMLAWIVEGAVRRGSRFAEYPERVKREWQEWRDASDNIGAFIRERCEFDAASMVSSQELFTEFKWFMDARGHKGWTESTFASRLGGHPEMQAQGAKKKRTRSVGDISRPSNISPPLDGDQVSVWSGLKWKADTTPSWGTNVDAFLASSSASTR